MSEDDAESLFGSPPPSPPSATLDLALPTGGATTENVGTIALPGSRARSEHTVVPPVSRLSGAHPTHPRSHSQQQQQQQQQAGAHTSWSASPIPAYPRSSSTPTPTPSSRTSSPYPVTTPETTTTLTSGLASIPASDSFERRKRRKVEVSPTRTATAPPARPQPPPIPLPAPGERAPANFLRNQAALLGVAGLVGGLKPSRLTTGTNKGKGRERENGRGSGFATTTTPARRGSTPNDPIVVDGDDDDAVAVADPSHPKSAVPGSIPGTAPDKDIIANLARNQNFYPVLQSILNFIASAGGASAASAPASTPAPAPAFVPAPPTTSAPPPSTLSPQSVQTDPQPALQSQPRPSPSPYYRDTALPASPPKLPSTSHYRTRSKPTTQIEEQKRGWEITLKLAAMIQDAAIKAAAARSTSGGTAHPSPSRESSISAPISVDATAQVPPTSKGHSAEQPISSSSSIAFVDPPMQMDVDEILPSCADDTGSGWTFDANTINDDTTVDWMALLDGHSAGIGELSLAQLGIQELDFSLGSSTQLSSESTDDMVADVLAAAAASGTEASPSASDMEAMAAAIDPTLLAISGAGAENHQTSLQPNVATAPSDVDATFDFSPTAPASEYAGFNMDTAMDLDLCALLAVSETSGSSVASPGGPPTPLSAAGEGANSTPCVFTPSTSTTDVNYQGLNAQQGHHQAPMGSNQGTHVVELRRRIVAHQGFIDLAADDPIAAAAILMQLASMASLPARDESTGPAVPGPVTKPAVVAGVAPAFAASSFTAPTFTVPSTSTVHATSAQPAAAPVAKRQAAGPGRPAHDPQKAKDAIARAKERRAQLAEELKRARVELWETTIEQGVLLNLAKEMGAGQGFGMSVPFRSS
ncbi:hypothetical protein PUNSTDRAFT_146180 [Punctularia strigosozonata HHB-11173 SS5]|uniref:Uncharacterized protein n=1 Tax=Punctularia strigosozonata (strain HHB-11173) TaxID=741275 RepID=R7S3T2_PUNST|nr:uncharacterized protein PUNSTDRAFT_146180 [Punctularia strigosozonata HHB-11173 SS5]EIN04863.1 hypothetical protein PUNSTDRAFT_146180 [Punctularia strigosozonata HHB-11173 SS5]